MLESLFKKVVPHFWYAFRPDSKRGSNTRRFPVTIAKFLRISLFWRTSANGCFRWNVHYHIISNEKSYFIPKQIFEYNKTIIITHFLKDQIKCKSYPSFFCLLIEKSQIRGKKWRKTFLPNIRLLLFILKWRNTKFSKK